jgi:hypothetical protein
VDTQGGLRFREFKLHTALDGQVSHISDIQPVV